MGSEQSQPAHAAEPGTNSNIMRLQRGHTIAVSGRRLSSPRDETAPGPVPTSSRPVSPPISVCSDSDLPYISYTDKLGGKYVLCPDMLMSGGNDQSSIFRNRLN